VNENFEKWKYKREKTFIFIKSANKTAKEIGKLFFIESINKSEGSLDTGKGLKTSIWFCPVRIEQKEAEEILGYLMRTFTGIFNLCMLEASGKMKQIKKEIVQSRMIMIPETAK